VQDSAPDRLLAQVYVALTWYRLHTEEIEADILADSEETLIQTHG
jgi:hypothetical protein